MSFTSFAAAALQVTSPVSMDAGFSINQPMNFQQDTQGNRVIIAGGNASGFASANPAHAEDRLMPDWGGYTRQAQASAIGNLISVTITGNNNTVVLNTTQINLGNQTAIIGQLPAQAGE